MTVLHHLMRSACLATLLVFSLASCGDGELRVVDRANPERSPGIVDPDAGTSSGTGLTVLTPSPGDLLTSELVQVTGVAEDTLAVVVNGKEVTVEDGAFTVTVVLPEGDQTVVVDGEGHVPVFVPIVVDARAPTIELTSPARGTFLVSGQTDVIDVKGVATDAVTSVAAVRVNGELVPVDATGGFAAQVTPGPGGNILVVEAEDTAGHSGSTTRGVVYGQYGSWDSRVPNGIDMRMREPAVALMEDGIADALLESMSTGLGGGGGGDVEVEGVSVESVTVDLVPRQGFFDATITIVDMRIDAVVEQEILFITTDVDATITMDSAVVRTQLYISPNQQGGLTTQMQGSDVRLHGFELDLDGIFELVEGFAEDYVEETTLELFEQALAGDAQEEGPAEFPVDLLGQSETMIMYFTRFDIDPGGFGFAGDMGMDVAADPSMPPSPGYLLTAGSTPPNEGFAQMVRFSMADDLFNFLLGKMWNAGLLNSSVSDSVGSGEDALTAGTFALVVGSELLDHANPEAEIGVKTTALLPPVTRFTPDGPHDMEVIMADTMLEFRVLQDGFDPLVFATVAASFIVHVDFVFVDGALTTEVTTTTIVDLDSEPVFDIDDERFETVIAGLVENLPAALGDDTGAEPAPDATLVNGSVAFDGSGRDFLSIYTDVE